MNPKMLLKQLEKNNPKIKEEYTCKSQFNEDLSIPSSPPLDFLSLFLISASLPAVSAKCNSWPALN